MLARRVSVALVLALAPAACAVDAVPDQPSWQLDVMPVLAANCVRCHSYPTNGYATAGFRLDAYGAMTVVGGGVIRGASDNATTVARRTRAAFRAPGELAMPPGRELGDDEVAVLRNWAGLVDGSLKAPRGAGRVDNHPPTITVVEVARVGAVITFAIEVADADRDLVVGTVVGPTLNTQGLVEPGPIADVVAGRAQVAWDTTGLPAGSYDLVARLDDGADVDGPDGTADFVEIALGPVDVVAAARAR
ncbi:MAG: hypothetical protein R3B06_20930 [Kofleriaceae bacterium]